MEFLSRFAIPTSSSVLDTAAEAAKQARKLEKRCRFVLHNYKSSLKNRLKAELIYVEEKRRSAELTNRPVSKEAAKRESDALVAQFERQRERVKAVFAKNVPEVCVSHKLKRVLKVGRNLPN